MTPKGKRIYSREFKLDAIQLYETTDKTMAEVEQELGIAATLLSKWKRAFAKEGEQVFPGRGQLNDTEAELRRLRREIVVLKQERETLKKAVAIFSHPK